MTSRGVGMVRRMDELGRVVIPKEVRKSFRIGNHEPLEILIDGEDTIVLRKFHSRPDLEMLAQEYAETLYKSFNQAVLMDDSENIIAVAGLSKKEYLNGPIPEDLQFSELSGMFDISPSNKLPFSQVLVEPIPLSDGIQGRIMLLSRNRGEMGEAERKTLKAATTFLSRWMDKNR